MPLSSSGIQSFSVNELSLTVINSYSMAVLMSALMLFGALVASIYFLKEEKE